MLKIMKKEAPIAFWDFVIDEKNKIAHRTYGSVGEEGKDAGDN
jgi:hypothetical protein